ncbi:hypothetical protein [Paenibacillus tarimensis]|nr:hypothetical protein [Paenibacillus tarimensis]
MNKSRKRGLILGIGAAVIASIMAAKFYIVNKVVSFILWFY